VINLNYIEEINLYTAVGYVKNIKLPKHPLIICNTKMMKVIENFGQNSPARQVMLKYLKSRT
jgi:hypothetical protein